MTVVTVEEAAPGVAVVTVNDPERRNAITPPMITEVIAAFDRLEADASIGAVVITGAPPAFCAGADLSALGASPSQSGLRGIYEAFLRVGRSPLPTIAAVNGAAVGAGMNLALCCDLRLAARRARFDTRFLQLGLHPGGGHTWMMRRAMGPEGTAAMVLFGEVLDGEAAERAGLAWRCVDDDQLLPTAVAMAERAAAVPGLARRIKQTIGAVAGVATHDEAVDVELEAQVWSLAQPEFADRLAALRGRISSR
ncbi:MAG TPA: enoyl-CoA hydratase [Acidimicrobiales bacterium]|nr:enoyl-CoA hydratase [Acidimicrobiales bacterium]